MWAHIADQHDSTKSICRFCLCNSEKNQSCAYTALWKVHKSVAITAEYRSFTTVFGTPCRATDNWCGTV